jgi:hypothetical protein
VKGSRLVIKAHEDVLKALGIEHAFLTGAKYEFCALLELGTEGKWIIALGSPWTAASAVLNLKYAGSYFTYPVTIAERDSHTYWLTFTDDSLQQPLKEALKELEEHEERWNKRKEDRFTVGVEGSKVLGLKRAEQKVILANQEGPCLINDISFGGIKLTTLDNGGIRKGGDITVVLDFTAPPERMILPGIIQAVTYKTGTAKSGAGNPPRFAIISLRFAVDPPLAYRQRLGSYLERIHP